MSKRITSNKKKTISSTSNDTLTEMDDESSITRKRIINNNDSLMEEGNISNRLRKRRKIVVESDDKDENENETIVNTEKTSKQTTKKRKSTKKGKIVQTSSDKDEDFEMDDTTTVDKSSDKQSASIILKGKQNFKNVEHYLHETLDFLKPENIKDINGNRPDDPEFDSKTLFIPESFIKNQSPLQKQWWQVKALYFDTILFFKVGKFYELYHMDAIIGGECLNLTMVRGYFAHCGFPEISYGKYSDMLISRGYKVARVEQTETPDMRDERVKNKKSEEKVVNREVCRITTFSTKTYGVYDGSDDKNYIFSIEPNATYLMSIVEFYSNTISTYGVALIDTSVGKFIMSQFIDDNCRSTLRTLLANFQPCHILNIKNQLTKPTLTIFSSILSNVEREGLTDKKEFLIQDKIISELMSSKYLGNDIKEWPEELSKIFDTRLHYPVPLEGKELAVKAFGGLLFYLKRCLIDVDMITMKRFELYIPPILSSVDDNELTNTSDDEYKWEKKNLIIDGSTLLNLHLVPPFYKRKASTMRDPTVLTHSLLNKIDKCKTSFGKRLLRQWICSPTCNPDIIYNRQESTKFLMNYENKEFFEKIQETFHRMPDLERLVQKINTLGLKYRRDEHPDGRAQMMCKAHYDKRKINDLVITLNGFEKILLLAKYYQKTIKESCDLIDDCLGDGFLDITKDIKHFKKAFDHDKALQDGLIIPYIGVDKEYDLSTKKVMDSELKCKEFCELENEKWNTREITLCGTGKNRYMLEFPDFIASQLDKSYIFKSQRKGYRKFEHVELTKLTKKLFEAEYERDKIATDITRRVFEDFSDRKNKWNKIIYQMSILDCICSFSIYGKEISDIVETCYPEFDFESNKPYLEIKEGNHPLLIGYDVKLAKGTKNQKFISNDTNFGEINDDNNYPLTILLTGPNMGGKSTIMRQTAMLIIMAHMGCIIPAKLMKLTPCDRIFSRIGAHDLSFIGQSTFYVELNETKSIINNATKDSFVLIDELGRGTSTNDGTAIAGAVLHQLSIHSKCRMFFSTHYFSLCDLVKNNNNNVKLAHMSFAVNNENLDDPTKEEIIFHYKLVDDACKRSYGFNAAKLAGIPNELIHEACLASSLIEKQQIKYKKQQLKQKKMKFLMDLRCQCRQRNKLNVDAILKQISAF